MAEKPDFLGLCWLEGCPRSREGRGREGAFVEHLLGAGLAMGVGMCSEAVSKKQDLSPWQSWLAGREWAAQGRESPISGRHRQGLGDPAGFWGGSSLCVDTFGQEGSVPRNRLWVFSLRGQEPLPLKGEKGQLDADPTFCPSHRWRNRLSAQPGAQDPGSCPSSGLCQAPSGPQNIEESAVNPSGA